MTQKLLALFGNLDKIMLLSKHSALSYKLGFADLAGSANPPLNEYFKIEGDIIFKGRHNCGSF